MNAKALLKAAKAAPKKSADFGIFDEGIETKIDAIDTELMKLGTLSKDTIEWDEVAVNCQEVFKTCSHMRAFNAAIFALCSQVSSDTVSTAFELAQILFKDHWPDLHPVAPRALRLKKKLANDILGKLTESLLNVQAAERKVPPALTKLAKTTIKTISDDDLSTLKLSETIELTLAPVAPAPQTQSEQTTNAVIRDLDTKGRAELRRDIKSVADRISSFDPKSGVAFQMRAYAAWLEHKSPIASDNGRILQHPMPANIEDEFTAALNAPSHAALRRLEDRLYHSPDWFEGQKLAHDLALLLEADQAANAILDRCADRLQSAPELVHLSYANGRTIVSKDILDWIKTGERTTQDTVVSQDESEEVLPEKSIEDTLLELDAAMPPGTKGREAAFARLALLEKLAELNIKRQTIAFAMAMKGEFASTSVTEWDPNFFQRLDTVISKSQSS